MRFLIATILVLASLCSSAQTMFMQRFKLTNNDSVSINVSEVRVGYEMANGNIQLMYGYPNSSVLTLTDFDWAVANSCGNLVEVVTNQNGVNKRMAINPQWLYRLYRTSGQTRIQMREGNQIFVTPGSYEATTALFDDCLSGAIVSIDTITISGDTICITLSSDPVPVCLVTDLLQHIDTATLTQGDSLLLSLSDDGVPVSVVDMSRYSCRWQSVKCAMPYYGNNALTAFDALVSYWTGRVGEVVVDTTVVVPANRTVPPPVRFVGAGNISQDTLTTITFQNYVSAQPKQHIFTGAGLYGFDQRSVAALYPYWFGAVGDGAANDRPEIQKTLDAAISSSVRKVQFLGGNHVVDKGLLIRNGSLTITIEVAGISGNGGEETTVISTTDSTNFVIGVQGARNVVVRDLSVVGKFSSFNPAPATVLTKTNQMWRDSLGRQSRYSPYAGIVVDPLTASAPADGGYPGFSYSASSASIGVLIDNVTILAFTNGVSISPHGASAATNVTIQNSRISKCYVGVSTGNVGTVGNIVSGTFIGQCKTGMTGAQNGSQRGLIPYFTGGYMVSVKDAFIHISSVLSGGGVGFANSYLNVYRLGGMEGRAEAVRFLNVECVFMSYSSTGVRDAGSVLSARDAAVVFIGGKLIYPTFRVVEMNVRAARFEGAYLHRPVLNFPTGAILQNNIEYERCKIPGYNAELSNNYEVSRRMDSPNLNNLRTQQIVAGQVITYQEEPPTTNYCEFSQITADLLYSKAVDTMMSVTVDTSLATARWVSRWKGKYRVGDIVYANGNATARTPFGILNFVSYGVVTSISPGADFDTVRTSFVGDGVTSRGGMRLFLWEMPRFTGTYLGNIDSGSNAIVVTSQHEVGPANINHVTLAGMWPVGMRVYSEVSGIDDGLPNGLWVTSVSGDTIYLSGNAKTTASDIEFWNADLKCVYHSKDGTWQLPGDTANTVGYRTGDEIRFYDHPYRRKATVVRGGFAPLLRMEFYPLSGLAAYIPSPAAIDSGLTYFAVDDSTWNIWDGTGWVSIGGGANCEDCIDSVIGSGGPDEVLGMNAAGDDYEWKEVLGTQFQVNVNNSPGQILLSLPQNVHLTADPEFYGLNLTGGQAFAQMTGDTSNTLSLETSAGGLARTVTGSSGAGHTLTDYRTSSSSGGGRVTLGTKDGAALAASDQLGKLSFSGTYGAGDSTSTGASVSAYAETAWFDGSTPGTLSFSTTSRNAMTESEKMRLRSPSPTAHSLELRQRTRLDLYNSANTFNGRIEVDSDSLMYLISPRTGEMIFQGKFCFSTQNTTTLSADKDNWVFNPANTGALFYVISPIGASRTVTGMMSGVFSGQSRMVIFYNNSTTNSVTFLNNSASSTDLNRFDIGADFVLEPGKTVTFVYHNAAGGAGRWRYAFSPSSTSVGGGNGIYGGDDLLPNGGTTVGLDSGSLKLQIPNAGGIRSGLEILGWDANTANRMINFYLDNGDSSKIQEDANGWRWSTFNDRNLILNSANEIAFIGDSAHWNEGIVPTVTSARFLYALASNGRAKRFDADSYSSGTALVSDGSSWLPTAVVTAETNAQAVIYPAQIAATTNDYAPTGYSTSVSQTIVVDGDDSFRTITGLSAPTRNGVEKSFENDGTNCYIFAKQHTSSSAGNRFDIKKDVVCVPGMSVTFRYDSVGAAWRLKNSNIASVTDHFSAIHTRWSTNAGEATSGDSESWDYTANGGSVAIQSPAAGLTRRVNIAGNSSASSFPSVSTPSGTGISFAEVNNSYYRVYARVITPSTLSTAAVDYDMRLFAKAGIDTTMDEGMYINYQREVNSGGWTLNTHDGSTLNVVNAGSPITTSTAYELELIFYPYGEVTAFINGTRYTTTSNLPASIRQVVGFQMDSDNGSNTATAVLLYIEADSYTD